MTVDVYVDNAVTTRIPKQLIESDIHGKGAAEIGWGSPGDFARCEKFAKIHGIPAHMRDGFCANLHKLATGEWPGRNAHKGMHALIASAALDYMIASAAKDTSKLIRWEGPLALVEQPTGDRRRFPRDTLTYQTFPMPFRFQRVGLAGHQGAITVGVIEHAAEKDHEGQRVVYGHGYFLDPAIVPEVNEAVHLAEHGVTGPSVDLDSYTAVVKKNALSGETTADMVRGRQRAATLVSVPAFANLRIKITRPTAIVASSATFAVNTQGWHGAPIAPREALFDADDAAKRIEGWANGDPKKMASMFLWIADSANAPLIGRKGYRLPWGDIVEGKPYLIYHAVYAAAALLEGAHGGLPNIPDEEKVKLRTVVSSIYEDLAAEYNDPSIVAPWDRQAQQQASGEAEWIGSDGDEYDCYVFSYTAALEEFVRHHRYNELKHPRDKRKNDHAGEWVDTPHGPHGQIKVGGKWVYPPKRGEKGYKNPEKSARGIAKRGGGKPGGGGEGEAKRGPGTHVVRKAKPQAHKAAPRKERGPYGDDHEAALRSGMTRDSQKGYLRDLSDDEIDALVKKVGGVSFDDDTRDEKETEIIRRVNKPRKDEEEDKQRRKDEETKRKDKELRELDHGNKRKTTIGKKEPGPGPKEKEPEKPKPEAKKPAPKKEAPKKEAPAPKPEPKPEKPGTTVGKKEHKLSPAQQTALENVRDHGQQAKIHASTRKVLEREGYLNVQGNLTEKGRKHVGGGDKTPEKPEKPKTPGGTVVGKKEHRLTPTQKRALGDIRDLGPSGAKIHPSTKKVLEREGLVDEHGGLTNKGRKAIGMPEREPKKPKTPEKPQAPKPEPKQKKQQSLAAKHKLTQNQKDELRALHHYGPVNVDLMGKQTRESLERKGLINSKGELTEEGKAVAKELVDAEPKPVAPPPAPKDTRPKPRMGHWSNSNSPRPVPKFPKPKDKNPDLEGPQRPRVQTRRERELHYLREELKQTEQFGDEWLKMWEEALARAKREGGDVSYYERMVQTSKDRKGDLKARIGRVEKAPKEPYWDTPEQDAHRRTGTPTPEQVDAHVKQIVKGGIPPIYRPQVQGQLRHQGAIVPRSLSTLESVDIPTGHESLYHLDPKGYATTLAYYQPAYRRIHVSPRWEDKPVDTSGSVERGSHAGWFHLTEDGTTPMEAILSHEVGHHVAYRALANVRSQELLESIIREYKLPADTKVNYKSIEEALKKYADGVKHELSVYGTSSIQELLAETWAEYTNGGKHLRPHVKRVGDIMRELAEDTDVVV